MNGYSCALAHHRSGCDASQVVNQGRDFASGSVWKSSGWVVPIGSSDDNEGQLFE